MERAIRFVRDRFFAARAFTDLADLNAQARGWCAGEAAERPCPEDRTRSVGQCFKEEQPRLLHLPENPQHVQALVDDKRAGRAHRAMDRLHHATPSVTAFFVRAAAHGIHLASLTRGLLELLETHGAAALEAALRAALREGITHLASVRPHPLADYEPQSLRDPR